MTDAADKAADYQARLNAEALGDLERRQLAREGKLGMTHCRAPGCGVPIDEYRRLRLHAQLCLDCTQDAMKRGEPLLIYPPSAGATE